jgi:membrane protein implicated in regulation of membrane protease activity
MDGGSVDMGLWFWFWVLLGAILLVLEIFTAGFFMLPFAIGAGFAAVLEFLRASEIVDIGVGWQWVGFLVVSAVALWGLRRFSDRVTHEPPQKVGVDRVLGKTGIVIEELDPSSTKGRVRVTSEEWRGETSDGTSLSVGTRVMVERVEGARLIVTPCEADACDEEDE